LALRQQVLLKFQREIRAINDAQRTGLVPDYQAFQLVSMEESELFKSNGKSNNEAYGGGGGGYIGGRQNMTDEHRTALHKIKERDSQMDVEIMEIGKVVDELGGMARTMNEEVKIQSKMIDSLGAKIDNVHGHVTNINAKLKTTIEEARKSDKICMDILCLIILIGMIIVLVKVSEKNK
jgi:hypothetical protein